MRTKTEVVVERMDGGLVAETAAAFASKAKAESWLRRKGQDGETYRAVRVVIPPSVVQVQTVERRSLVAPGAAEETT